MKQQQEIIAVAEHLVTKHQAMADVIALERAQRFFGDAKLRDHWLQVTDKVRELQNRRLISRTE